MSLFVLMVYVGGCTACGRAGYGTWRTLTWPYHAGAWIIRRQEDER